MLLKYYKRNILLTGGFTFVSFLVYFIIYSSLYVDHGKSGWPTPQFYFPYIMSVLVINALVIGLSSFPLFLNKHAVVRNNPLWSAASWFGLPAILIVVEAIWQQAEILNYTQGIDSPGITPSLVVLSCFAGLMLPYIQFRKEVGRSTLSLSHTD